MSQRDNLQLRVYKWVVPSDLVGGFYTLTVRIFYVCNHQDLSGVNPIIPQIVNLDHWMS